MHQITTKLLDSHQHGLDSGAELMIVEGLAAANALALHRNPQTQAIFTMQGKPMNTLNIQLKKLLSNTLFKDLIDVIGCGVGNTIDFTTLRYQRILIQMDPDADGIHSGVLMLLFFYQWMRPLLAGGHIALVRAPVGEVFNPETQEKNYAFNEAQYFNYLKLNPSSQTIKYRGLAGIPPEALMYYCLDNQTRQTEQMQIKDAEIAIKILSGSL